jgi:hypothetical protein
MNHQMLLETSTLSNPTDFLRLALRTYAEPPDGARVSDSKSRRGSNALPAWAICFDTETTIDPSQHFRFGTYQVRWMRELRERGIFYDPNALSTEDMDALRAYASKHGLKLLTLSEFVEEIIFGIGYDRRAAIIGFNLPFDISRLASEWASARLDMRDGFTLRLSSSRYRPHIQVKHISQSVALIRFAATASQRTWRSERKRNERVPVRRGCFIDVKTIAAALLSLSCKLDDLAKFLGTPTQKETPDEHGGLLTDRYIHYALQDTQVTWECYQELADRYARHNLTRTPLNAIFSEASLGKAILREMNIRPWRSMQSAFSKQMLGWIWNTYFGGRSEVNIRRAITRVRYCDFLSMYATICTLLGLWRFMRADGIDSKDTTAEVAGFLASVKIDDLQPQEVWRSLTTIVEVIPDDEVYPLRSDYGVDPQYTIGLNHIRSGPSLWFTLADCIAAKLHVGRCPKVIRAITFSPRGMQKGLKPISIAGNPDYRVDPSREDFFKKLIELRQATKELRDTASELMAKRLDTEQNQLKTVANATSYGIYAESNVDRMTEPVTVTCYGSSGEPYKAATHLVERPGAFQHPLMASLITGGARLMLTIAERLAAREGLDWVFCDTDSIALAKPDGMSDADFNAKADAVQQWFVPLNPYAFGGPLLQTEKFNYRLRNGKVTKELEALYCYAVSSKRYVLFNLDTDGRPVIRKASAHGLGHLLPPYPDGKSPRGIPAPAAKLSDIGVRRWEYDLWYRVVLAALDGHPDTVDWSGFKGFDQPAISRYNVTKPELLRLFDGYNKPRAPEDQVRPFNFLLSFQANVGLAQSMVRERAEEAVTLRPRKVELPRPIAPYTDKLADAADRCFDRDTGKKVAREQLRTYREVLARYHLHPESKFLNADWTDRGKVQRRHVEVVDIVNIGKEANELEEQFYLGAEPEAMPDYGMAPDGGVETFGRITAAARRFGRHQLAEGAGISLRTLASILGRKCRPTKNTIRRLLTWISRGEAEDDEGSRAVAEVLDRARAEAQRFGLRRFAAKIGVDPANLAKVLAGKRRPSEQLLERFTTSNGG